MSRNIGNQKAHLLWAGDDVVIEIASHRSHGHIASADSEVRRPWKFCRQNRKLDAASNVEFLLDFAQLLIALQGAASGHVAQASQKDRKAEWLQAGKLKLEDAPEVVPYDKRDKGE